MPPIVLTAAQLKLRNVGEDFENVDLEAIIMAEEAYLAGRIGPLLTPYVQTFHGSGIGHLPLDRRVSAVTSVVDAGVTIPGTDYALVDGYRIVGLWGDRVWIGPVVVTATVDDVERVRLALVDLVRLRLSDTGQEAETAEGRSRSNQKSASQRRDEIVADLLPARGIA